MESHGARGDNGKARISDRVLIHLSAVSAYSVGEKRIGGDDYGEE